MFNIIWYENFYGTRRVEVHFVINIILCVQVSIQYCNRFFYFQVLKQNWITVLAFSVGIILFNTNSYFQYQLTATQQRMSIINCYLMLRLAVTYGFCEYPLTITDGYFILSLNCSGTSNTRLWWTVIDGQYLNTSGEHLHSASGAQGVLLCKGSWVTANQSDIPSLTSHSSMAEVDCNKELPIGLLQ